MQRDGVKSGLLGSGGEGADGTAAVLWFQVEIVRGRRRRPVLRGSRVFWMFGKPLVFYKAVAEAETVVEVSPPPPPSRQGGHTQCAREFARNLPIKASSVKPKPKPKPRTEQNTTGEETMLRSHLERPCCACVPALVVLLSHFHDVRPLLCWRDVRHRRVLPLGRSLVLHLLFLDPRRRVSVGLGQGPVAAGQGGAARVSGAGGWGPSRQTWVSFMVG